MTLPAVDEIGTERLRLRPVRADDLPDLLAVNGDPDVTRFLPYPTWTSLADGQAWLARMQALEAEGAARQLVVVRADDGRRIGTVLLFRHEAASARIELGYVIGRACWRQGYAREALAGTLDHAFGPMGIRRVEAEVDPDNHASNALLRALGFRHEGVLRQRWVAKGRAHDVNAWGLLASEWPVTRARGR